MDEKQVREAIEIVKNFPEWNRDDLWLDGEDMEKLVNTLTEALEKQLSKKGIKEKITEGVNKGLHKFYCPVCYEKGDLSNKCNVGEYCSDCGQKIDWSK